MGERRAWGRWRRFGLGAGSVLDRDGLARHAVVAVEGVGDDVIAVRRAELGRGVGPRDRALLAEARLVGQRVAADRGELDAVGAGRAVDLEPGEVAHVLSARIVGRPAPREL